MKKALELKLMVDGKEKKFTEKFVPAARIIDALDLIDFEGTRSLSDLYKERVSFIANLFTDDEVTEEVIWNGLNALDFNDVILDLIYHVAGVEPKNVTTEPVEE